MRPIDADKFEVVFDKVPEGMDADSFIAGAMSILQMIEDAPTVGLVRCKDCKWHYMGFKKLWCWKTYKFHEDDWFCGDGERKE